MRCVLLIFSSVLLVNANVPACNEPFILNPPQNTEDDTWYPLNFTNSQPPIFPDNFECECKINVPQGWYSLIRLTVNMTNFQDKTAPVQVVDQLGRTEDVFSSQSEYFVFIASGGKIKLSSGTSQIQFGFKLSWKQYPAFNSNITHIDATDRRPQVFYLSQAGAHQFNADYQVSATIMPYKYSFDKQYFRGVLFFDGPSTNSTLLGTGLQLLNDKVQYHSSGKPMTIMFVGQDEAWSYASILLQDYENTKDIVQFQAVTLDGYRDVARVTMDATNGPVAVQTFYDSSNTDVIKNLEGTGRLDVYLGGITKNKTNLATSYLPENCQEYLPQVFYGQTKTYVLTGGVASMNITQNAYDDFDPTRSIGRKGILVTEDYGILSKNQNFFVGIYSPNRPNTTIFRYSIQSADLVPGVTFQVTNHTNGRETILKYDSSHLPYLNLINEIQGEAFFVHYYSNENANKGVYLNFEIIEKSAHNMFSVFAVIIYITMALMY